MGIMRSLVWCGEVVDSNQDGIWKTTTNLIKVFAADHATLVTIDLAQLRFVDSSGAALMMKLKEWSRTLRLEIIFVNTRPTVRNILRLTAVDQLVLEGGQ